MASVSVVLADSAVPAPAAPIAAAPEQLGRRILGNSLVQLVIPALKIFTGLGTAAILSRYLGVRSYGAYGVILAYVAIFIGVFNEWGLSTIALREISRRPAERPRILASAASLQATISVATYGLLVLGLLFVDYPVEVKIGCAVMGLMLLFTPLDILALSFQADLKLVRLLPINVAMSLLGFALVVALVLLHAGLVALIASGLLTSVVAYSVITRMVIRREQGMPGPTISDWLPLLKESWPLAVNTIFSTVMTQGPLLLLAFYSLRSAGLYAAASKLPLQLILLPLIIRTSTFPVLSRSWVAEPRRFGRQLNMLMAGSILVALPALFAGIGLAPLVVRLLFGRGFVDATLPFQFLVVMAVILIPLILVGEAMIAAGFQRTNLAIQAVNLPFFIALGWLLAARYGAAGVSAALAMSYFALLVAHFVAARVRMRDLAPTAPLLPAVVATAAGTAVMVAGRPLDAGVVGLAAAAVATSVFVVLQRTEIRALVATVRGRAGAPA